MQVDINQPKSKAFNVFLRMLQLGGQLILGYWATRFGGVQGCDNTIVNIISYMAYALAGINLIAVIYVRCAAKFPRVFFFLIFILDLGIAAAVIGVMASKGTFNCAANKIYYQYSIIQPIVAIVVCFVILIMRLGWGQRYTNSPGNIVWGPLFLINEWTTGFKLTMLIIGIGACVVSVLVLLSNLLNLFKTSTSTRKIGLAAWGFGIFILILLEILALVRYFTAGQVSQYEDVQAKKTLQLFIVVNVLDILFWLWGYKTFDYEKGDHVRQDLFSGKQDFSSGQYNRQMERSTVVPHNIGTINN